MTEVTSFHRTYPVVHFTQVTHSV